MAVSTTVQVTLPAMGESVNEGTVLEWLKAEGDEVEVGETLVEISTDKVDAEIPSPASGTLLKIHVAAGETVEIGALLAEIQAGEVAPSNGAPPAPEAAADDGPAEIIDIVAPTAGESVSEGTLLEWLVKPGDSVDEGQTIVEFSTDKVDIELPAPASGKITELLAASGDTIAVGQLIARMELGAGVANKPAGDDEPASSNGSASPSAVPEGVRASPVAARVAAAEGVELDS
ncbi:MAG: multifunctional oxoglutarate decarboxylase/oxoglutarate dehydrogenase thiamine pyrophosphate-binding subunit/dihydrolipoyllysine-residue succinyltransferase subunit, partial [Solirubrobacteraceae bacterium]|nr:multifunctional oxoglutarate decarboxylase/oxoglutarate dehydrogenase thiamine pyrophosphate-binding subunit/dihydrolipoyllysine-residue succinyltransferase subunit [Solirubrobacteraceae bacterium]